MNTTALAFGKIIKKMRAARGLSQSELADACRLDRTFISMMERGLRQPTLSTIFSISKALRIPAGDLVGQAERSAANAGRRNAPHRRL